MIGSNFKIEELNFVKPKAVGSEKYVQEFPEELLEKIMNEDELKAYSEKSKTIERKIESEPNSPMP